MKNITAKELNLIKELLENEYVLIKKLKVYSDISEEAPLKTRFEQLAAVHITHFDKLLTYLKQEE